MQLQPIRISKMSIVGYLVLIGCWLLPLMVQAQGNGKPTWWRAIEKNDSDHFIGYGSGSTHQKAHSAAAKEIAGYLETKVDSVDTCVANYLMQGSKINAKKKCLVLHRIEIQRVLTGLEPIKEEAVTNPNKRPRFWRHKPSPKEQTTYYIALGYDATDLIGKVVRVIKNSTDPEEHCALHSEPLVPFDKKLQGRLKDKEVDVKDDCVINWSLARNKRKKTNADIQWTLKALGLSLPITLDELRRQFWPETPFSKWLSLTTPSPLFYEQWFKIYIAANPDQLPTSNPDQYLSLLYVDQAGRVVVSQKFNDKLMESKAWKEQTGNLHAWPTPGQPNNHSDDLVVAVLCTAEAQWPHIFPAIGKKPATSGYLFNELIDAIKSRRQEGSCHVAAKSYTMTMQEK